MGGRVVFNPEVEVHFNQIEQQESAEQSEDECTPEIENMSTYYVEEEFFNDLKKDKAGATSLICDNLDKTNDPFVINVIHLPVKEHGRPECVEAKISELNNLIHYETFEEILEEDVRDEEIIGIRWILTEKEQHDGQKTKIKARLVAKGFQEQNKPQSDSPAVAKESFKLCMAVAANEDFGLTSIDIRAAFLQAKI